jgi:hypothetical protein
MSAPLYNCGHPRTDENTVGSVSPRCRTCRAVQSKRERENRKRSRMGVERLQSPFRRREIPSRLIAEPPLLTTKEDVAPQLEKGSRKLLEALYQHHPYVFDAAERDERRRHQVVRP